MLITLAVALLQSASAIQNSSGSEPPTQSPPASVYAGRARNLDVRPPRISDPITVDGALSESPWERASILTQFSTYNPVDGRPAQDSIEVRLFYGEDALYVGVRAWAPEGTVRATLAERDRIQNDDWIALHLDTFNDQRRSFVFAVNPLGVQADGMRSEQSAGPGVSRASMQAVDLSQNYLWQSAGRVLDDGFEIEVRIPFKSIRFQMGVSQDWGVQVVRQVQRTGYQETWTPVSRAQQSFSAQQGHLRGLSGMKRGLVLDLTPTSITTTTGTPDSSRWKYGTRGEFGGDVRWGLAPNLTLNATANPDFSQVETDVGQIPGDVRFALFFPELRPFFVEGSEQFDAPNRLVNTRSIIQPVGALKLTGKLPRTDLGFMSAIDAATSSRDGASNPIFNIVRLRRDVGDQSTAGLVYTDRAERGRSNRVAGLDARLQFANYYSAEFRLAGSVTRDSVSRSGSLWEANHGRSGRRYGYRYGIQGFSPGFQTEAGFVNRVDFVKVQVNQRITRFGKRGGWWDQQQHFVTGSTLWTYNDFTNRQSPLESQISLDNALQIRGGWRVSIQPEVQRISFDPRRYAARFAVAANRRDTAVFTPSDAQVTGNLKLSVNTPQWRRLGATITATGGTEPEFFETSTVNRREVEATVDLRPTPQIRLGTLLRYQRFVRRRDGTEFSSQLVPRVRLEYQFSKALFLRFVGQVESRERDALRDPRTELPLFTRSSTGKYTPIAARRSLLGRADWLLSYLPSPGTVIFLGYGTALDATDTFRPGSAERTSDGAFVKFSYLYRVRSKSN
jgi:hypothetical protein